MWYPRQKSNVITQMVANLNTELGAPYFKVAYEENTRGFTLNLAKYCSIDNSFNFIAFEGVKNYSDMVNYLEGILLGLKAGKIKKS